MDFLELAKCRYAVRDYENTEIREEDLMKILEAGRVAPTGANRQPQKIYVIKGEAMAHLGKHTNLHGAKMAVIIAASHEEAWVRTYDHKDMVDIDASIVTTHMMLEAASLGIGSLWICSFDPKGVHEEFAMPADVEPVNILCLGYARGQGGDPKRHDTQRKPLTETVTFIETAE